MPIAQSGGGLVVSFAGFAGFVAVTTLVALDAPAIETADTVANAAAAELARGSPWIAAARVVTWLGKTEVLVAGTALAAVTLGARRAYARAGFVVTSVAAGYAVRWSVRAVLERPRPEPRLHDVSDWAFPSGHAANIATIAVLATLLASPYLRKWGRVALVTAAAATSVAVGVSRVVLLVHWPSDVAAGWLLPLGLVPLLALGADRRWPGWRGRDDPPLSGEPPPPVPLPRAPGDAALSTALRRACRAVPFARTPWGSSCRRAAPAPAPPCGPRPARPG